MPKSNWTPPALNDLPTDWGRGKVGVDIETRDPDLKTLGPGVRTGGYIVGVSVAITGGPPPFYLPIRHAEGPNLPVEKVIGYLKECAARFEGEVCGANLTYDLDYLAHAGVHFPNAAFRDVQVADPLINELHRSYSLAAISERWGFEGKDTGLMDEAMAAFGLKGGGDIWRLPARYVGPYAEQDAVLPLRLLAAQESEIDKAGLREVYDLESRVLPVTLKMRRRGVAIDLERLNAIDDWARAEQTAAIEAVNAVSDFKLAVDDITKTAAVAQVLQGQGVDLPLTATGKPSVTSEILAGLDLPVAGQLRRAKKMSTLRLTFVESIRRHQVYGRIHCTFSQLRRIRDSGSGETGTISGRMSSSNPNLQQQPARDPEIGKRWRSIYRPDDGAVWACLDYSQQEPRMAVHYADQMRLEGAAEAARRYREDPNADFHAMMADIAGVERKAAKEIYLGLSYGMGSGKLCRALGLPTQWMVKWSTGARRVDTEQQARELVAQGGYGNRTYEVAGALGTAIIEEFNSRVPFVRALSRLCEDRAREAGRIRTICGRQLHFPKGNDGRYDFVHKAMNRLIQGSSADQTKRAMVDLDAAGVPLALQVHDELDFSAAGLAEAKAAAEVMRDCLPLRVPFKVDVEVGPSWGEVA